MAGMVRDSSVLSKLSERVPERAKEKNFRAVIQNHYVRLNEYADGRRSLLAYIQTG